MKRPVVLALVSFVLMAVIPTAMAAAPKGAPKNDAKETSVTGKLTNLGENSLTVDVKGGSKIISLTASTRIVLQTGNDKKDGTKVDLKVGQEITVTYTADTQNAIKIVIKEKKGK